MKAKELWWPFFLLDLVGFEMTWETRLGLFLPTGVSSRREDPPWPWVMPSVPWSPRLNKMNWTSAFISRCFLTADLLALPLYQLPWRAVPSSSEPNKPFSNLFLLVILSQQQEKWMTQERSEKVLLMTFTLQGIKRSLLLEQTPKTVYHTYVSSGGGEVHSLCLYTVLTFAGIQPRRSHEIWCFIITPDHLIKITIPSSWLISE